MKHLFTSLLFCCLATGGIEARQLVPQTQEETAPAHILFEGIELKGDIFEYSKEMQQHGYKLERRDNNARDYYFKGNVCGVSTRFKVSFTRHSKTVYRVMAQPKNLPLDVLLDTLNARYGEPADFTDQRYFWQLPTGAVMLSTPVGYDPTLVFMDAVGVAAFKDEDSRQR